MSEGRTREGTGGVLRTGAVVTRVLIRPCVLDSDIVSERGLMCLFQQVVRLKHYHNAPCSARVSLTLALDTSKATLNIRGLWSNINSCFGHQPKYQYDFKMNNE